MPGERVAYLKHADCADTGDGFPPSAGNSDFCCIYYYEQHIESYGSTIRNQTRVGNVGEPFQNHREILEIEGVFPHQRTQHQKSVLLHAVP